MSLESRINGLADISNLKDGVSMVEQSRRASGVFQAKSGLEFPGAFAYPQLALASRYLHQAWRHLYLVNLLVLHSVLWPLRSPHHELQVKIRGFVGQKVHRITRTFPNAPSAFKHPSIPSLSGMNFASFPGTDPAQRS